MPGVLHRAEHTLGMRHEDGEAPVGRGEPRDAGRRAVGVAGVGLRHRAAIVDKAQRDQRFHCRTRRCAREFGVALAIRHRDRHAAAHHALEEQRGRALHLQHHEARLELLRLVAHEVRPCFRPGDELVQIAHHLAAVAHAERERVGAPEERLELLACARIEQDRFCPSLPSAEHVAVGKAAAGGETLEILQADAPGDDIAHVHVHRGEPRAVECRRHLGLAVHALLSQYRHPRARAASHQRCRHVM